ncbi:putative Secreted protein [Streptomyces viridochromogenes Tue57]|uniref:Putative Secreted protein n=1 Tax=Streptomyces viridochromogenes Tue57 TaxID=1160705 RepID=L8PKL9_STRVR|nr:putative Secreted protein [Streptomyces viridochromogenes Tue57]
MPAASRRGRRTVLAATGLVAALALTATACDGSAEEAASDRAQAAASQAADGVDSVDGKIQIPADIADKLKEHGIDVDKWANGGWRDWDKDKWLSAAEDFVNPVMEGLWKPDRMQSAKEADKTVTTQDASVGQGVSDPEPAPVEATAEKTPYHDNAAPVGKVFFDSPDGPAVCSGTVIKDVNHPGTSNLVWTAGHCVHAGGSGGWYRNIVFVPAYNDLGEAAAQLSDADATEIAPYGNWWADWVSTSNEWIQGGSETGGAGAAYDYAVLHVEPEQGTKSLEETVGAALDVDFSAPSAAESGKMGAWGYPAAPPYNGLKMFKCIDRPGRLSLGTTLPTMYRIGCTMTGGSSGGGWFRVVDGETRLVSNTSIGPEDNTWLAGPQLGPKAEAMYQNMSRTYGGR